MHARLDSWIQRGEAWLISAIVLASVFSSPSPWSQVTSSEGTAQSATLYFLYYPSFLALDSQNSPLYTEREIRIIGKISILTTRNLSYFPSNSIP